MSGQYKIKWLDLAKTLPKKPGCYLFKNKNKKIIYVGKAKDLKNRVASYFNDSAKNTKTTIMVGKIVDLEFIITENEAEAFILENTLIKKHTPRYNIRMRDDKSYPYVLVDFNEPFPRLKYTRRVKRGKNKLVLGPFVVGSNISEVLRITNQSFGLRDCSLREFKLRKEPCLLYQLKQCSAPCVDYINKDEYDATLANALKLFQGKGKFTLKLLEEKMMNLAEREEFEHAALVRDQLKVIESFVDFSMQKNAEIDYPQKNIDFVAYHVGEYDLDLILYIMRDGVLLGHKNFHIPLADMNDSVPDEVSKYLLQYYCSSNDSLPQMIISSRESFDHGLLEMALSEVVQTKLVCKHPSKKLESLYNLAHDQAREVQRVRIKSIEEHLDGLIKLKELLQLKERPSKLECYDIAIWQGQAPAASQIVCHDGELIKERYRHYHLRELPEGNNDFAMMKEVIKRRVKHGDLPDVFIVDGGKGQVSSFLEVLKEEGVKIPVVGIAKAKSQSNFKSSVISTSEERLIIPGRSNPYMLSKNPSLFKIVVKMRNEAHRFSRRLHHKETSKRQFQSWLDEVSGVGPKTKEKILRNLDRTPKDLSILSTQEISSLLDVSERLAENIKKVLLK